MNIQISGDRHIRHIWRKLTLHSLLAGCLVTGILVFTGEITFAQKENKLIREGNKLYDQQKYKDAEMNYRKAIDKNKESTKGKFNLGASVYQQKNYEEAARLYSSLADTKLDKKTNAAALHNLGNSLFESKDYENSIRAYENALLKNPSDVDTKYNLEYAKMMLKKQQQQQQQNKNDQNKDNKDQQKKDQKDQNKDQQKKEQNQNQNKQDQNKKISKEDAERMLEALKNDEKKTLAKLNKEKAKAYQQVVIEKDW